MLGLERWMLRRAPQHLQVDVVVNSEGGRQDRVDGFVSAGEIGIKRIYFRLPRLKMKPLCFLLGSFLFCGGRLLCPRRGLLCLPEGCLRLPLGGQLCLVRSSCVLLSLARGDLVLALQLRKESALLRHI